MRAQRGIGGEFKDYTLSGDSKGEEQRQQESVDSLRLDHFDHFQSNAIKGSKADDDWMKRGRGEERWKPTRGASVHDWGR